MTFHLIEASLQELQIPFLLQLLRVSGFLHTISARFRVVKDVLVAFVLY